MDYQEARKIAKSEWQQRRYDLLFNQEDPLCIVYLILVTPGYENPYYKIGYSKDATSVRFKGSRIPSFVCLAQVEQPLSAARLLEKTLHDAFSHKKHVPLQRFGGWSECFHLDQSDVEWITEVFKSLK